MCTFKKGAPNLHICAFAPLEKVLQTCAFAHLRLCTFRKGAPNLNIINKY